MPAPRVRTSMDTLDTPLGIRTVFALLRRWPWLVAAAIIAALACSLWMLLQPPVCVSTVHGVPQRARTEVNYESRIRTVSSDSGGGTGQAVLPLVSAERRTALAHLVRSVQIEEAVRSQLGETLPGELRAPGRLL